MEKIYAAPINADYYAVFVGDKKLTLPLSESDAKKIADRYNGFEELQAENLKLSALLGVCKKIATEEGALKREGYIFDMCNILDSIVLAEQSFEQ